MKASRKLERFIRKHRPAGFPVKREEIERKLSSKDAFEYRGVAFIYYEGVAGTDGAYYEPQLRFHSTYRGAKMGRVQSRELAKKLGYTEEVFVPWDAPVVELPIPPWVDVETECKYPLEWSGIDTTLCYQSEVARLTGPFIKYLTDLAKGKVS